MLDDLYAGSVADAATRSQSVTVQQLERLISNQSPALDSLTVFESNSSVNVIAEIKRASPSRGDLAPIPDPAALARLYQNSGASAISVLTEQRKFKGTLDDLKAVRNAVSLPILRKDFIANEYQILEARAFGADLVLLIVAGLNHPQLRHLFDFIESFGMQALVETHSAEEVKIAADLGAKIIGVNARNLRTFETDIRLFENLISLIPSDSLAIAESAIRTVSDVENYAIHGAQGVLVGEALVTGEPDSLIRSFAAVAKHRI